MAERCPLCGNWFDQLTVHHIWFSRRRWHNNVDTVRICWKCHQKFNKIADKCLLAKECLGICTIDQELMCCYSGWFGNVNFKPAKCVQKKRRKRSKKVKISRKGGGK